MEGSIFGMAALTITVAVMLSIGTAILGSEGTPTADCTQLAGYMPAGVRTSNHTVIQYVPGFCQNSTLINKTTQEISHYDRVGIFGPNGHIACVAYGSAPNANHTVCINQRAAQVTALGPTYRNFKDTSDPAVNGCIPDDAEPADIDHRFPNGDVVSVRFSVPDQAHQEQVGYCYARQWSTSGPQRAYYYMSWTVQTGTQDIPRYRNVTSQVQAPDYPCQVPSSSTVTTNTTGAATYQPGSWAAACVQAQESAHAGYTLLALVVVILAAGVALFAVRSLRT